MTDLSRNPTRESSLPNNREHTFALVCFSIYLVLVSLAVWRHAFWRDEALAWIIARDSPNLCALWRNLRYEPHPPLWHLVLYIITRFTWNPGWMKIPNLLAAMGTVALVLFRSRLAWPIRIGFVFSYFTLFEYGVISREYMLGLFLMTAAVLDITYAKRFGRPAAFLSLAALTSLPALLLALAIFGIYLLPDTLVRPSILKWTGVAVLATCFTCGLICIHPPSDSNLKMDRGGHCSDVPVCAAEAALGLTTGYLPLPYPQKKFWNTTWTYRFPALGLLLGPLLLAHFISKIRERRARWFLLAASALIEIQLMLSNTIYPRYSGWLFVALIFSFVLDGIATSDAPTGRPSDPYLFAVLGVQVLTGLTLFGFSVSRPFSSSQQVADFLSAQGLAQAPMVIAPDFISSPILAYLRRPTAYFVEREGEGSVVVWNREEFENRHIPTRAELSAASHGNSNPVLITDRQLSKQQMSQLGISQLGSFTEGFCEPDRYFLYR